MGRRSIAHRIAQEVHMKSRYGARWALGLLVMSGLVGLEITVFTQEPKPVPQVKSVAATPISSIDGHDNYVAYCAVCHGQDAKGNGPAAPAMKAPVPDLTMIAQRHKGQFSATDVEQIIRGTGRTPTPAHGVAEMPIWGNVFLYEDRGRSTLRISNLVKYLQSIQVSGK
jgi:mono/diheme cytochrome c family protein